MRSVASYFDIASQYYNRLDVAALPNRLLHWIKSRECLFWTVSSVPAAVRSGGAEPDAGEGDGQLPVPQPEGVVRTQRGASLPGRLCPAQTEHPVAQDRQRERRPFHRLRRYR